MRWLAGQFFTYNVFSLFFRSSAAMFPFFALILYLSICHCPIHYRTHNRFHVASKMSCFMVDAALCFTAFRRRFVMISFVQHFVTYIFIYIHTRTHITSYMSEIYILFSQTPESVLSPTRNSSSSIYSNPQPV